MKIKNLKLKIILLQAISYLLLVSPTYAANPCPTPGGTGGIPIGDCFGFGDFTSLGDATTKLVNPVFSIAAFLVILYFLLGAFKYLQAGETKEDVSAAKQMIVHAIVGFIILMFAFLILQVILGNLFKFGIGFFT